MHNVLFPIEKNQVDREQHADGMDPVRGDNPEAAPRSRPLSGLSEKTHQPPKIGIGHRNVRSDESLARPIQHTHPFIFIRHNTLSN
jgi:hypothetical protein